MLVRWLFISLIWPSLAVGASPSWKDSFLTRLELMTLIETFNADLLSHASATATLERWCADHGLAREAKVAAMLERGAEKALDGDGRKLMAVQQEEPLRYRHVRLVCGDTLMSEADNWYAPGRLTPEMNRLLEETDTPFGKAVRELNFRRETLSARLLWLPLPEHWETQAAPEIDPQGKLEAPGQILEHRALLRKTDGTPLALVVETYASGVLGFPLPEPPVTRR
jgi:chorismate-pyruvate lyase